MGNIAKLEPFISHTVWGGKKLAKIKNIDSTKPIGETWEVSTLDKGSSRINGSNLSEKYNLSYLVKFIDTEDNLSVQVHPDCDYARKHESSKGKTECWLILDAAPGAGIYLGLKDGVTKKEFQTAITNNLKVNELLNFKEVSAGDFFFIPAGTIHAIGNDVTLCEVQQSSGITYRVWDWNRVGLNGSPRELHIEKAMDVINFTSKFNKKVMNSSKFETFKSTGISDLVKHDDFKVELINFKGEKTFNLNLKEKSSIVILKGQVSGDISLNEMESAFILSDGEYSFASKDELICLLVS